MVSRASRANSRRCIRGAISTACGYANFQVITLEKDGVANNLPLKGLLEGKNREQE